VLLLKQYLNLHVTSDDGCEWHITGTADIDFGWSGVTVGYYDVTHQVRMALSILQGLPRQMITMKRQ